MTGADRPPLYLIPIAAAIAILPLALHGPSYGHDINFHLLSWMEAARQFSHGTLHPRWAYSAAYNAGEPRFVFYPPLSWMLGALLGLVLTHLPGLTPVAAWSAAPSIYIWICLTASGLCMYRAARVFAGSNAALIGSVLYLANPYMLFTAYERAAYGELLSAAWMPLLLAALLAPRLRFTGIAVPVALLWLSDAPAAVIGCYTVAIFAILRLASALFDRDRQAASPFRWLGDVASPGAGIMLGAGLAGFYLVPAVWERKFVQVSMAIIAGSRVDQNFLFEHTGTSGDALMHDMVLHTASSIAVIVLVVSALCLLAWRWEQGASPSGSPRACRHRLATTWLFGVLGLTAFLLCRWSNPVWQHMPELAFLQFPWRLLLLVAPVGALAAGAALSRFRLNRPIIWTIALSMATLLTVLSYRPFHQVADPDETIPVRLQTFQQHQGFEATDEYTPQTADNDALIAGNPAYWLGETAAGPAPLNAEPASAPPHFSIIAAHSGFLILNLRQYPAWQMLINNQPAPAHSEREDGLITVAIAAGRSTVDIRYTRLPDEIAGDVTSLASVLVLATVAIRRRPHKSSELAS